jgi:hypothetical protein
MIFKNYPWDPSDQPTILKRSDKKMLRKGQGFNFFVLFLTNIIWFPVLFILYQLKSKKNTQQKIKHRFFGLCVNLDKGNEQQTLVEELGVKSLQVRFFLSDMKNIDSYVKFVQSFGNDKEILICVIQSREHIINQELLINDMKIVFEKFRSVAKEFIIGHTINRIKWGFVSIDEYLQFYKTVQTIRDEHFCDLKLIGSNVIDFEYHFTIRSLFNDYDIKYDKLGSLLYVDRRGSPYNTQYKIFDFKEKIEFLDTIVKSSTKSENSIYITEANWPLSNTAPFAPTSEKECVSEEEYTQYMLEYYDIAKKSGKIEKVYWHQLIAPGYGLVDNRGDKLRKMPQYYAYKKMIEECCI